MRIIDSVEINYFRSIYQVKLKSVKDYNVLVGSNDSGKSNILRALNLFFNNEISDFESFSFLDDVTYLRQDEARDAKGRLTIWIKITFLNYEEWKTLPEKFFVKKVWNRYAEYPELTSDVENQSSLTKFLNKIRFHYVPAVKTQDIYSYYLRQLYEILSAKEDLDLVAPAQFLSQTINGAVGSMSNRIRSATGVDSRINIPTNFLDIFERLSFSTQVGEYFVPLNRRGDGIQARHIPHIIEYISENNGKSNIWAYEEPENSLELSNAFELAEQFVNEFSEKNQIFITSHSPAFYGTDSEDSQKYFVEKVDDNGKFISSVSKLEDMEKADGTLGVARLIAKKSEILFEELRILKENNDRLSRLDRPVIVTEGITDVAILKEAQKRILGDEEFYDVFCCESSDGGGGGHTSLKSLIENIPAREKFKRVALFDRDRGGAQSFDALKGFRQFEGYLDAKRKIGGNVFAVILPELEWDDPYFELAGRPVAIEQMFEPDVIGRDIIKYKFSSSTGTLPQKKVDQLVKVVGLVDAAHLVKVHIEITDKKLAVARIKRAKDAEFALFEPLFEMIGKAVL
ncbi:DUF2813 domain-containing protein [Rhizobium sp. KAs_5_22]|uniref:ATP-dependent nuclease n=1 Tax=Ciceribacter selenitireducens TaxID=448181 RepID=UPI0004AED517|nr:AAA family ATPase [Ciceribacter selenitireducens]PPJ46566.1 DUF2813 domain-containing protein [Rhizobium sp. KAs_5_22]